MNRPNFHGLCFHVTDPNYDYNVTSSIHFTSFSSDKLNAFVTVKIQSKSSPQSTRPNLFFVFFLYEENLSNHSWSKYYVSNLQSSSIKYLKKKKNVQSSIGKLISKLVMLDIILSIRQKYYS